MAGKPMLNSASRERIEALDLAASHELPVVVTAAGGSGMPANAEERIENASYIVEAALAKGIPLQRLFVDALVFPISVDSQFVVQCLDAFRELRRRYSERIHLTGGLSNVSFGMPCRKLNQRSLPQPGGGGGRRQRNRGPGDEQSEPRLPGR
jgi:5-methyltetrahydrofolate--homocysteine methyltransferase